MEGSQNSSNTKNKIYIIVAIVLTVLILLAVIFIFLKNNKNGGNPKDGITESQTENGLSSLKKPVKIGEWTTASKSVPQRYYEEKKENPYVDIPVRITNVLRGNEAEKIVKDWFDGKKNIKYQNPKKGMEWMVIDTELDLTNLEFKENVGITNRIATNITGLDGKNLVYKNTQYLIFPTDILEYENYNEPTICKSRVAVGIPKGCSDYLIRIGDIHNGINAYVKGK